MSKIIAGSAMFVLLISVVGCTELPPAVDVVATKVSNSIKEWIGTVEIQRVEVLRAIDDAKAEVDRLKWVEAESSVEAEILSEKLETLKLNREAARKGLLQLADLIEAGKPITLTNGTTMSIPELMDYAERKKAEFEALNEKIEIYQESIDVLTKTAQEAHDRWVEGERIIETLEAQLELLDAKILALKAAAEQPLAKGEDTGADPIAAAEDIVNKTIEELNKQREVIERLREIQGAETDQVEKLLELDLKSSKDLASELRELAGE